MQGIKLFLDLLATSKVSVFGAVLVTTAVVADAMLIIGEVLIFESNPYIGIVAYVLFPGMAAAGLGLIPVGILLVIRRSHHDPVGKLVRRVSRKKVFELIVGLTLVNLVIFAFVGYRSIHFMESAEFCGLTCHEVMSPEYTVYQLSHHSGVACVECHVGPGVGWLIKSKLDGTRQLAGVLLDNFSRPIETPIHNMRPAEHICGECHGAGSYLGNRVKVIPRYESDEHNTLLMSVVNFRLGETRAGEELIRGIHWHTNEGLEIRYWSSDEKREQVVRVELTDEHGETRVWTRPGDEYSMSGDEDHLGHARVMDCVDCHNRPTHEFLAPDASLDGLIGSGAIDARIPWIRAVAYELITEEYETHEQAMDGIDRLGEVYRQEYHEAWEAFEHEIVEATGVLKDLHTTYVYPGMGIQWNTYPSRIGHPTSYTAGCFRCHDGVLRDPAGVQITNDCNACHFVLAEDEKDPIVLRLMEDR